MNAKQDCVSVESMKFYVQIGVADDERRIGQELSIDLQAYFDIAPAGSSDALADTVSYVQLVEVISQVCQAKPYQLIEHVAEKISQELLRQFTRLQAVQLRVHKPHIPRPGFTGRASVNIYRQRPA